MNVSIVLDWRFALAVCGGAAVIIAVSKMDPDGLQKTVAFATDAFCKNYAAPKRVEQ